VRILLTGGNGMVGKNIVDRLPSSMVVFAPTRRELDLLDMTQVDRVLLEYQPDMIIHAAGVVGGIQANIASPVKFLIDNMQMAINVLIAARNARVEKFMNISSSCMYPRNVQNPLREELVLKGELEPTNEGYALAKVTAARLCEYIGREDSSFSYKSVIPCNLYGRYDKFDPKTSHMIPAVIYKLSSAIKNSEQLIEIWGDGTARREFMFAEDFADFVFYAISNFSKMPQNLNVGLGRDYSINEYYEIIAEEVGYKGKFTHDHSRPVGMRQKLLDISRLEEFGWVHKTSLREGVKKTYGFYNGNI